jgi:flagellar hook protein FlgE
LTEGGKSVNLAQLSMAVFPNYEGMKKYNGSTMTAFASAGEPSIGTPGSGGRGSIKGEALEYSNVDMAEEFVNLIISQRSYQANTRVITTSDELYQEAINLKR